MHLQGETVRGSPRYSRRALRGSTRFEEVRLMPRLLLIAIALATNWALPAHAEYARSFEFAVDGVRPSSESGVTYTSGVDPETSVVHVGSGVMHFDTVGGTGAFYCVAAPSLDLAGDLSLAVRVLIADMEGPSHGGFSVLVSDGTTEYNLLFRPDGVAINVANGIYGSGGFVAVDHAAFHLRTRRREERSSRRSTSTARRAPGWRRRRSRRSTSRAGASAIS
jgi:hypothetical protein